jgi:hypothetical protein
MCLYKHVKYEAVCKKNDKSLIPIHYNNGEFV